MSLLAGPDAMEALAGLRVIVFGVGGAGSWRADPDAPGGPPG